VSDQPVGILDTSEAGPAAIRGGVLRAGAHAIGVGLALISAPLLIRHLGVEDFGRYVLIGSIVATLGGVLDAGLISIAQREYVVRQGAARDRVMRDLLGLRLLLMFIAGVAAVGFAAVAGYDATIVAGTAIASVGLLIAASQHVIVTPLIAGLRYGTTTALDLLSQVLIVGATIVLVVLAAPLLSFVVVPVGVSVILLLVTVRLVRGLAPLRPGFDREEWWLLVRDTLPFAVAAAIGAVYFRSALIVLSLVNDPLETGYYATSYRLMEVVLAVPVLVVSAAFPILSRAAEENAERLAYAVRRMLEVAVLLGLWFLLVLELGAEVMIDVLAGSEGEPAVAALRWQAPAVLFTFIAATCGFTLLSLRRHREVLVSNVVALAVSLTGTLLLGRRLGADGAAIATVAAEALLATTMAIQLVRIRPELRFPLRTIPPLLAAAGIAACAALLPVHDLVRVAVATAVYFGALFATGRIPFEIFEALRPGRRRAADGPG
jgi:O-antigen/teichoic acid export membrane protein